MKNQQGRVVWITGLSGAGKTTLATAVVEELRAKGQSVVFLDGDELRAVLGAESANSDNHGRDGRLRLAMRYASLCRLLSAQRLTVVIATISLFKEIHEWNRKNLSGYFEVYLNVPMDELRRRDPKGIYTRFDAGELSNVAGLDLPVDEPVASDMVVQFAEDQPIQSIAHQLINRLDRKTL